MPKGSSWAVPWEKLARMMAVPSAVVLVRPLASTVGTTAVASALPLVDSWVAERVVLWACPWEYWAQKLAVYWVGSWAVPMAGLWAAL